MEALESKRRVIRARKSSCTADISRMDLITSIPASQASEAKHGLHTIQPESNSSSLSKLSTEVMSPMKRRRMDEESVEIIQKRSPTTIATTTTSTFSYKNRLNDIRYTYEDEPTGPSEKVVLMEHCPSDPHPLCLETPELSASSSAVQSAKKPRKHKLSIQSPSKPRDSKQSQLARIGSRRHSKSCRTAIEKHVPRGTKAQPINLSDTSDQELDSEATTDGESDRPVLRVNNIDGANESEQDHTLSDSDFESQGQLKARGDGAPRESRLGSRKEAYRAAKDLAGLGWGNGFVIVSSNAGRVEEETEL